MQWCVRCSPSVAGLVVGCGWGLLGQSSQIFVLLMVDKTIAAYDDAGDELKGLQQDLEGLQTQIAHIHETLQALASNIKARGFKRLLLECVLGYSLRDVDRY
jgi:septal ring factor EnvC (AmiA/AmiB activator)